MTSWQTNFINHAKPMTGSITHTNHHLILSSSSAVRELYIVLLAVSLKLKFILLPVVQVQDQMSPKNQRAFSAFVFSCFIFLCFRI